MNQSEIDWRSGRVLNWDIDDLDLNESIDSQIDLLKEDLAQVEFGRDIILNLAWFPEFNPGGQFVLCVMKIEDRRNPKGEDWENPILEIKFRDMSQFILNLNQAIETANRQASDDVSPD
jgi:hypothetical protein